MKQKRRCFQLLLVCVLFLLTACGTNKRQYGKVTENRKDNKSEERSVAEQAAELLPQKLIRIGFVQVGHESDWRIVSTKSCLEAFSEENGYQLYFVDADNDPKAQVQAVRNFIREQVDYIIIDPVLTTGWIAVLKEAYHADIPVFLVDRTIDCDSRYYRVWFGSDFVLEGECAGQWLQNYLNGRGRGQEEIRIVTINGTTGASAQIGRTEGFAKYLERNNNWVLLDEQDGDFTEAGGREVMERYLEQYTGIDVVVCQNDNEAIGACEVLQEAGISYGKGGEVIVISFDATRAGLEAVLDGKINADFECNPLAFSYVADAIRKLEKGEVLVEKKHYLPEDCFTSDAYPMTLITDIGPKKMIQVTRELIDAREY